MHPFGRRAGARPCFRDMQWISSGQGASAVVAIDPLAQIERNYAVHVPSAAGFSLPRPYQAPLDSEAPLGADAEPEGADGGGETKALRKRKKGGGGRRKPLNPREQEASARHDAIAPLLAEALATLQQWLAASGAATLRAALVGGGASGNGSAAAEPGEGGGGEQGAAAEEEPSYPALYQMRQVVRPKLEWARDDDSAAQAGGGEGEALLEDGDLFGRLVSTDARRERRALAAGHPVLLPPRAAFLMSDITALGPLLPPPPAPGGGGYHCIVLDPPWENRSASRGGAYATLPSRNLLALPLRRLAHADGCLVALWVTNRERHRRFVEGEALAAWGLTHVATWHWLKVTDGGQPVGRLDCGHRRPYESALLCYAGAGPPPPPGRAPPDGLVLAAVPAHHSRKPHLGPLLAHYLPPQPRCLELFARELFSGPAGGLWASWGNEALKFQSLAHFSAVKAGSTTPSEPAI